MHKEVIAYFNKHFSKKAIQQKVITYIISFSIFSRISPIFSSVKLNIIFHTAVFTWTIFFLAFFFGVKDKNTFRRQL